jgi:hypothetical protein
MYNVKEPENVAAMPASAPAVREREMPCGVALDQALHDHRRHNLAGNAGLHPIGLAR